MISKERTFDTDVWGCDVCVGTFFLRADSLQSSHKRQRRCIHMHILTCAFMSALLLCDCAFNISAVKNICILHVNKSVVTSCYKDLKICYINRWWDLPTNVVTISLNYFNFISEKSCFVILAWWMAQSTTIPKSFGSCCYKRKPVWGANKSGGKFKMFAVENKTRLLNSSKI